MWTFALELWGFFFQTWMGSEYYCYSWARLAYFFKRIKSQISRFCFYMLVVVSSSVVLIISVQISGCFTTIMGSLVLFSPFDLQSPFNCLFCKMTWNSLNFFMYGLHHSFMIYYLRVIYIYIYILGVLSIISISLFLSE